MAGNSGSTTFRKGILFFSSKSPNFIYLVPFYLPLFPVRSDQHTLVSLPQKSFTETSQFSSLSSKPPQSSTFTYATDSPKATGTLVWPGGIILCFPGTPDPSDYIVQNPSTKNKGGLKDSTRELCTVVVYYSLQQFQ